VPVDLLLVIGDEALRQVIEVALLADGHVVRTASGELEVVRILSDEPPDVLILDSAMPLSPHVVGWTERNAPDVPLILLRAAFEERPPIEQQHAVELLMPFGRIDLRRAITAARAILRR
jgi:DNA-binding response OmpR family regulator